MSKKVMPASIAASRGARERAPVFHGRQHAAAWQARQHGGGLGWLGSAAFGTAAIISAVVSNAGQGPQLVRSPRIAGVSVLFLILAVVNQALWLSWAILVPDTGTMIFASVTGIITVFNLTWWSLRNLGLRPLLAGGAAPTPRQQRSWALHLDE